MNKNTVKRSRIIPCLIKIVIFLVGTITAYAQSTDTYLDDSETFKTDASNYYKNINNYDIFVETYDKVINTDTVFDEFGLKHAYFFKCFLYAAVPKQNSNCNNQNLILNRLSLWYKLPVEGKDTTYFNQVRQSILPFSSNYHYNDNTFNIFKDFTKANQSKYINKISEQISDRFANHNYPPKGGIEEFDYPLYYERIDVPQDEFFKANLPFVKNKFIKDYFDSIQLHNKETYTQIKDNFYIVPTHTLSLIDEFFVNTTTYFPFLEDVCNFYPSTTSLTNVDYTMLNDSTICMFHNHYYFYYEPGAFYYDLEGNEKNSFENAYKNVNYLDSILLITDKGVQRLDLRENLQNALDSVIFVHKNGILIKTKNISDNNIFVASTDRDTILNYLKPNSYLFNYFKNKEYRTQPTTINSPLTYTFQSICDGMVFGPVTSWFDTPSSYEMNDFNLDNPLFQNQYTYDTVFLSKKQQSPIRKEFLKLARLKGKYEQLKIESETYYKYQYENDGEWMLDRQHNLSSHDKTESNPKYQKKVKKLMQEIEKCEKKLKNMGYIDYYYIDLFSF